ncbi:FAD:protein FMN transferase [Sinorhizobium fredii]|uniref:FAD:protein FMN transferase n=1 Tax=Rhizobium fredii TaxID=380 RepID=UPI0005956C72|nr:FAD:protein FMN transferase [Sinorhizobium fredii]WOS64402.1 FAD:protein FMN transferase [Sinorhizobium fredii GR64]
MGGVSTSRFEFDAIGTSWEIDTPAPVGAEIRRRVLELVDRFDSVYSRFRDGSLITRIAEAENGGTFEFPPEAAAMFDLYDQLHEATDGAVDPLIGRDLELLGYDREYSLIPALSEIATYAIRRPRWDRDVVREGGTIVTRRPLVIDLGAVGKGCLVDLTARLLEIDGVEDFVVDGSGDMLHRGDKVLDVGLEHPLDPTMVVGVARLRNASLCASAINRRRWGDGLHHVLDARSGAPVNDVLATWVVSADTATADALATALFFGPASRLTASFDFTFVRMFADGRVEVSGNFDGGSLHLRKEIP